MTNNNNIDNALLGQYCRHCFTKGQMEVISTTENSKTEVFSKSVCVCGNCKSLFTIKFAKQECTSASTLV